MQRPLQKGDVCLVIDGFTKNKSPNIGKIVTIHSIDLGMPHSRFGQMYLCRGEGIMQLSDNGQFIQTNEGHFAKDWLKRIEPPQNDKSVNVSKELVSQG